MHRTPDPNFKGFWSAETDELGANQPETIPLWGNDELIDAINPGKQNTPEKNSLKIAAIVWIVTPIHKYVKPK
ncbi:MAG: hypothetical protein OHK0037_11370 [Elainellaceae cyanobacterium]